MADFQGFIVLPTVHERPAGPVKAPEFDEQTLPLHFECLAAVSTSRLF